MAHRALADITESIRELTYYRRTAFVPHPDPRRRRRRPSPHSFSGLDPPPDRLDSGSSGRPPRASDPGLVGVAQLVEPRLVVPAVAGSSPVAHPAGPQGVSLGASVCRFSLRPAAHLVARVAPFRGVRPTDSESIAAWRGAIAGSSEATADWRASSPHPAVTMSRGAVDSIAGGRRKRAAGLRRDRHPGGRRGVHRGDGSWAKVRTIGRAAAAKSGPVVVATSVLL